MKGLVFYGDRRDREITNYFLNQIGNQRTDGTLNEKKLISQVLALSFVSVKGNEQDIEKAFKDIKEENLESIMKDNKSEDKYQNTHKEKLKHRNYIGKFIDI
jgi:hypothetical protein